MSTPVRWSATPLHAPYVAPTISPQASSVDLRCRRGSSIASHSVELPPRNWSCQAACAMLPGTQPSFPLTTSLNPRAVVPAPPALRARSGSPTPLAATNRCAPSFREGERPRSTAWVPKPEVDTKCQSPHSCSDRTQTPQQGQLTPPTPWSVAAVAGTPHESPSHAPSKLRTLGVGAVVDDWGW